MRGSGEKQRLATVRLILAKIKDRDIELRTSQAPADDDALVIDVLQKMVKQRRESITLFEQGGRPEKAAEEQAELEVLEAYLPQQLSDAELESLVAQAVAEAGVTEKSQMGQAMKAAQAKVAGRAEGGRVAAAVKKHLA